MSERRYCVLDKTHLLKLVTIGTEDELLDFFRSKNIRNVNVKSAVLYGTVFNFSDCEHIIIEDFNNKEEIEEEWELFQTTKIADYYVSNFGRVMHRRKNGKKTEVLHKVFLDKNNVAVVHICKKVVQLKNLVAKHFKANEYNSIKKPIVMLIDNNPFNCNVNNLKIISQAERYKTRKSKNSIKCALYKNGKKVKVFNSLREAGHVLYYDYRDLSKYFAGETYPKYLPFDLRLEPAETEAN